MSFVWTTEQTERCKSLWLSGHSASMCALALGGDLTRSAIIGKMNRIGAKRSEGSRSPTAALAYPKRAAYKHTRRRNQPAPAFVSPNWKDSGSLPPTPIPTRGSKIESPNASPWIARTALQCAFPVGDKGGADQWSCCNPTGRGLSYCPGHAAAMFNGKPKPNTAYVERKATHQPNFREWAA